MGQRCPVAATTTLSTGEKFLRRLVSLVREHIDELRGAVFYVYVDEYENLENYQQTIINSWLKHSEPPLIFNLAMKRNGFKTRATEGGEALSDIHDFRDIDLEDFDLKAEFPAFAAEILLLRLALGKIAVSSINPESLHNPSELGARREPGYRNQVVDAVTELFPTRTYRELAIGALQTSSIRRRLEERVTKILRTRNSRLRIEDFVSEDHPEASIIVPALLSRHTIKVDELKGELNRLKAGAENRFTGSTNWIHNNFVGCFLQIYDGFVRPCPIYGGFKTYCFMARGNLRHFLELCHQALARSTTSDDGPEGVGVEVQAEAARQVSADFLAEVRSFGSKGNDLHTFLLRLGSLFSLSQQSPAQSEPERTHFSIQGGTGEIEGAQVIFLSEAVKWSVLFEEKGTKKKTESDPEGIEYVLNPIYAPYFHISHRKRRKLELSGDNATTLISGSYEDVKRLLRRFQKQWSVDLSEASLPLFAHLHEDDSK